MKNITFLMIALALIFASCSKTNNGGTAPQQTPAPCSNGASEYICWEVNGNTYQSAGNIGKGRIVDSDAEGLRHYSFGDHTSHFYLEFENPTEIIKNQIYIVYSNSQNAFDWDCGFGTDTLFTKGTFVMRNNTPAYIEGEFTAKSAEVNGNPINLEITRGWFKLYK